MPTKYFTKKKLISPKKEIINDNKKLVIDKINKYENSI